MKLIATLFVGTICCFVFYANSAFAQTGYASSERSKIALGHYARARAMLVEALSEFEQAEKLARPDLLIDSSAWRTAIVTRAEELNRVLDPHPRISRHGVRFKASSLLVREPGKAQHKLSSDVSQTTVVKESQPKGVVAPEDTPEVHQIPKEDQQVLRQKPKSTTASAIVSEKPALSPSIAKEKDERIKPRSPKQKAPQVMPLTTSEPASMPSAKSAGKTSNIDLSRQGAAKQSEDEEVAKAIEAVIQERIAEMANEENRYQQEVDQRK